MRITRRFVSRLKYMVLAMLIFTVAFADTVPDYTKYEDKYGSIDEIIMG